MYLLDYPGAGLSQYSRLNGYPAAASTSNGTNSLYHNLISDETWDIYGGGQGLLRRNVSGGFWGMEYVTDETILPGTRCYMPQYFTGACSIQFATRGCIYWIILGRVDLDKAV